MDVHTPPDVGFDFVRDRSPVNGHQVGCVEVVNINADHIDQVALGIGSNAIRAGAI